MNDLRTCPFCGGSSVLLGNVYFWVSCLDCDTESSSYETAEEAVAAWNSRVGDELMERMVDDGK